MCRAWDWAGQGTEPNGDTSYRKRRPELLRAHGPVKARMRGQYRELSTSKIVLLLAALAYIISPIDLVPELFIPLFGAADDVGVAVWLTAMLLGETERFLHWEQIGTDYIEGEVLS